MKLLEVGLRTSETLCSTRMRLSSLASAFSHSPLPDLERGLLNELVIVFVLLRNRRESVVTVEGLHLLVHHLVLGAVNMALQEVAQVRVVICLSIVSAQEAGNLVLRLVLRVENGIVTRADS